MKSTTEADQSLAARCSDLCFRLAICAASWARSLAFLLAPVSRAKRVRSQRDLRPT